MDIDPSTLRQVWAAIEETRSRDLLRLTDEALTNIVLQQISCKLCLTSKDSSALYEYISARTALIRDIVESQAA